jgi:hypothetical protein
MDISPRLERFHARMAACTRLHPYDEREVWLEASRDAARAAADAARALSPLCSGRVQGVMAAVDRLLAEDIATASEAALEEVRRQLQACCDLSLL